MVLLLRLNLNFCHPIPTEQWEVLTFVQTNKPLAINTLFGLKKKMEGKKIKRKKVKGKKNSKKRNNFLVVW